jgi:hypothetical protein
MLLTGRFAGIQYSFLRFALSEQSIRQARQKPECAITEGKKPTTDDPDQAERSLEWRTESRRRAARRRRWFRDVVFLLIGVVSLAVVEWWTEWGRGARGPAVVGRQALSESAATMSQNSETEAPRSITQVPETVGEPAALADGRRVIASRGTRRRAEARKHSSAVTEARTPLPRQLSLSSSSVDEESAQTSDVAAGPRAPDALREPGATVSALKSPTAAADAPAAVGAPPVVNEAVADRLDSAGDVTPTEPTPNDPQAVPPPTSRPAPVAVARVPSDVRDAVSTSGGCAGPSVSEAGQPEVSQGQPRNQAVADCVVGWLKGEVQEFRDGVKREIGEFRAGFDTVRRALQRFGSKVCSCQ